MGKEGWARVWQGDDCLSYYIHNTTNIYISRSKKLSDVRGFAIYQPIEILKTHESFYWIALNIPTYIFRNFYNLLWYSIDQ